MTGLDQITFRLNSGVQLTPGEVSLFLRSLLNEVTSLKEEINEIKTTVHRPGADKSPPRTISASQVRREPNG